MSQSLDRALTLMDALAEGPQTLDQLRDGDGARLEPPGHRDDGPSFPHRGRPVPETTQTTIAVSPRTFSRPARRPSVAVLAAIGSGGALGAVARYEIMLASPVSTAAFPWTTWGINLTGSLVLGVVATLVLERWPPTRYVRPFVGIGICGGYTTWSTFMTEAVLLTRDQRPGLATAYIAASVAGGLAATYAGMWAARQQSPRRRRRAT